MHTPTYVGNAFCPRKIFPSLHACARFCRTRPVFGPKRNQSVHNQTSALAGGSQRDPVGWMDRYSNAPGVSNRLLCNAPLSEGPEVYFRSVTRFNPAPVRCCTLVKGAGTAFATVAMECGPLWGLDGVRQWEHAPPCLVTPWVTMWTLDVHSGDQ